MLTCCDGLGAKALGVMATIGKHINEMFEKLPNWISTPLLYILLFVVPVLISFLLSLLFWKLYWLFILLFLLIPCISFIFRKKYESSPIPIHKAKAVKKILLIIAGIVVLAFAINFNSVSDYLSHKFIPNYSIEYSDGEGRYGEPVTETNISTSHWYWTALAYFIRVVISALLLLMIYIVFQQSEKMVEDSQNSDKKAINT